MLLLGNSYLSHTKSGCIQIFAKHFKCKYNLGITDVLNYTTVLKSIPESFKLIMVQWILILVLKFAGISSIRTAIMEKGHTFVLGGGFTK